MVDARGAATALLKTGAALSGMASPVGGDRKIAASPRTNMTPAAEEGMSAMWAFRSFVAQAKRRSLARGAQQVKERERPKMEAGS